MDGRSTRTCLPRLVWRIRRCSLRWPAAAVKATLTRRAGELAIAHGLRGFDAVHLAAALELRRQAEGIIVAFTAFDERLAQAARAEGLQVLEA